MYYCPGPGTLATAWFASPFLWDFENTHEAALVFLAKLNFPTLFMESTGL